MTPTQNSGITPLSLFDWAMIVGSADQSRWLKKYTVHEIASLLWRHKDGVCGLLTPQGGPAGLAIVYPTDEETVHIAFIVSFHENAMEMFQFVLQREFPRAKRITYLRRNSLGELPITSLSRLHATRNITLPPTKLVTSNN